MVADGIGFWAGKPSFREKGEILDFDVFLSNWTGFLC